MEVSCNLIKLKPGSLPMVRRWAETLNSRMKEVLATLHDETVVIESVFLLSRGDGDYLVYYMRAQSMAKAREAVRSSPHEIDAFHQQFKKTAWASSESTELILDASTLEDEFDSNV
jgi:hypothetical protein